MAKKLGTAGNDSLTGTALGDQLFGLAGNDLLFGLAGADSLTGGLGNDKLYGGLGADILDGGAGNDALNGGAGKDLMFGGLGNDAFTVDNVGDKAFEKTGQGIDIVNTSVDYTLGANIEKLYFTGTSSFHGTGNALANTILGGVGSDVLDGKAGADVLIGSKGNDSYFVDSVGDKVIDKAGQGTDTVNSTITYKLPSEVENLNLTGTGNINGTGNAHDNTIKGNSGNNVIDGGLGADHMSGGQGNDTYFVDHIGDVVTELAGQGTDTVNSKITYTLGAEVENLNLLGSGNINGTGNAHDNIINGNSGDNALSGGDGNDILSGGAGHNTLNGDNGNDLFYSGLGTDTIYGGASDPLAANLLTPGLISGGNTLSFAHAASGVGVDLGNPISATGAAAGDVWTSIDILEGSNFNDTLVSDGTPVGTASVIFGGGGDDILFAQNANSGVSSILRGDAGNDYLFGGVGTEYFVLQAGKGLDVITGFSPGQDHLLVSISDMGLSSAPGFLMAAEFSSQAVITPATASVRLIYDTLDHILFLDRDGNGLQYLPEPIAVIEGVPSLSTSDFNTIV